MKATILKVFITIVSAISSIGLIIQIYYIFLQIHNFIERLNDKANFFQQPLNTYTFWIASEILSILLLIAFNLHQWFPQIFAPLTPEQTAAKKEAQRLKLEKKQAEIADKLNKMN